MFFDTLFCSNSVSNYRQIVLIAFIVLFPSSSIELQKFKCFKQKLTNIPLMKTLLTTTDIILIVLICVSYSLYNCICSVSFYCDEFSYV